MDYFLLLLMDSYHIFTQYTRASTVLSVAGIRSQFSVAENIQMCQFSFQFLSDVGQILAVDGCDPPDIQLRRLGYLFLASSDGEYVMRKNYALQRYIRNAMELFI